MPEQGPADPVRVEGRLGRVIAARRSELGWKRNDLVREATISYPYLAEIENGRKMPSGAKLRSIAQALGLTEAELFKRAEELPVMGDDARPVSVIEPERGSEAPRLTDTPLDSDLLTLTVPSPVARSGTLDRRLEEAVTAIVRAELSAWARYELPNLIRAELDAIVGRREV